MPLAAGTRISCYEILSPLGAGGMGEVYRAKDTKLDREVAIKVLPAAMADDPTRLARFEREAKVLASLNHPHIAQIYGLEVSTEPRPSGSGPTHETRALVMELVTGSTLPVPVPLETALHYARQIAEALEAAHDKGITHRDLKPANIMVTPEGVVKVLDFGLASAPNPAGHGGDPDPDAANSPTMTMAAATQAGMIMGTAAYMSPEQARGKPVDRRADIWSFGVVLFEMLSGRSPFGGGETVSDLLAAVITREPDWTLLPKDTPPHIRRLIERCLRKDPKLRMRDIGDARLSIDDPFEATPAPTPVATTVATTKALAWTRLAALATLITATALGAYWIATSMRPSAPAQVTRLAIAMPAGLVLVDAPAISTDGRIIAYIARDTDGLSQLYVRDLSSFESKLIPGTDGARQPSLSPDGNRIGFLAKGKLNTVARAGGIPTAIADASFLSMGSAWGSDDSILYVSKISSGILRIPASGGKPEALTEPDGADKGYGHVWPQSIPGSKKIFFTIYGGPGAEPLGASLLDPATGKFASYLPSWNGCVYVPSGRASGHILVSTFNGVMAAPFDPNRPSPVRAQTYVIEGALYKYGNSRSWFAVSNTGTLAYVPGDSSFGILGWVDRAGVFTPLADKATPSVDPTLSPDGTRVVRQEGTDIWMVDVRRGIRTRMTLDGDGVNGYPIWSRDGKQVIFASNRTGDWELFSMSSSGGQAKQLLKRKGPQQPMSQAPDGTIIYSERFQGTSGDLWTLAPDGTTKPYLVSQAGKFGAQYSPDGKTLAYVSDESGREEVYIRSVANPEDGVAVSTEGGSEPKWSPDGKEIYFRRGDGFYLAGITTAPALSAGNARKLFDLPAAYGRGGIHPGYDVSADGKRLLVQRLDPRAIPTQINVVLNWFEELNTKVPPK